jgi:hypothetical protein
MNASNTPVYAYIRCGVPPEWEAYALGLGYGYPSRSTRNQWFLAQWNAVRRHARTNGMRVVRRFFDSEGRLDKLVDPLTLPRRRQLAELFRTVRDGEVRTVLVDDRSRLDADSAVRAELYRAFRDLGVRIVETGTGTVLTDNCGAEGPAGGGTPAGRSARKLVALWKGLVTRVETDVRVGQKPFGSLPGEAAVLVRVRELYRVLPRSGWRRRGWWVWKRRSFGEIATVLNDEQRPTRGGGAWSARTVYGILKRLGLT